MWNCGTVELTLLSCLCFFSSFLLLSLSLSLSRQSVLTASEYLTYFKPDIGASATILMSSKNRHAQLAETPAEKIDRLAVKDKEGAEERRAERAAAVYSKYKYEPAINNVSRALAPRGSTSQELADNRRGRAARDRVRREAEEKHREECTFRPDVRRSTDGLRLALKNERLTGVTGVSGGEAVARSVETLTDKSLLGLTDEKARLADEKARALSVRINLSEVDDLTAQVGRYNEHKEEVRRERMREREMEELKECTFAPRTNHQNHQNHIRRQARNEENNGPGEEGGPQDAGYAQSHLESKRTGGKPVVVRGLGRYLELRNMANQKTRLQKEREDQAFKVRGRKGGAAGVKYPDGTTQVHEFRLTQPTGQTKNRMKKEREEALQAACTFQPDTIEKRNRRIITGLLEDDESVVSSGY